MKTCRALFCALPLLCAVTFAQTDSSQATSSSQTTSTTTTTTTTQTSGTTAPVPGQILNWHGTLVDAACMAGSPTVTTTTTTTSSSSATPASESNTASANPNPATASDRDHPSADQKAPADNQTTETTTEASKKQHHKEHRSRMNDSSSRQSCPVSANTTTFGLKLDDGTVLKFDSVGNTRAASELKAKQKWTKDLAENKPIHAKVNGLQNGDTIIVTDIH